VADRCRRDKGHAVEPHAAVEGDARGGASMVAEEHVVKGGI
jgi:hypothetical protein